MNFTPERIEQISQRIMAVKGMRAEGYTWEEVSQAIERATECLPEKRIYIPNTCDSISKAGLTCRRHAGHRGVHLSDETGKLIYWE